MSNSKIIIVIVKFNATVSAMSKIHAITRIEDRCMTMILWRHLKCSTKTTNSVEDDVMHVFLCNPEHTTVEQKRGI